MSKYYSVSIPLFLFTHLVYFSRICSCDKTEAELTNIVTATSKTWRDYRPVNRNSDILKVNFSLSISQLVNLDTRNQVVVSSVWPTHEWVNPLIGWDPNKYDGITHLYMLSDNLWLPNLVLLNNVDGKFDVSYYSRVKVSHKGECLWAPPSIYKSSCDINIALFPFDEQICPLIFTTLEFDVSQMVIESKYMEADYTGSQYWENSEWSIKSAHTNTISVDCAQCKTGNHSAFVVYLHLVRKPLYYTVYLIIPLIITSLLTVCTFYLPSACCERITLAMTILLSTAMLLLMVSKLIPKSAYHVPLLNRYLVFIFSIVVASLMCNAFILHVHFQACSGATASVKLPRPFKHFLLYTLPLWIFMEPFQLTDCEFTALVEEKQSKNLRRRERKQVGEKLCFWNNLETSFHELMLFIPNSDDQLFDSLNNSLSNNEQTSDQQLNNERKQKRILKTLESIKTLGNTVESIHDKIKVERRQFYQDEEWKFIALVLDRILLWLFSSVVGFGSVAILNPNLYTV
ncbi:acetylcholine receptor subunit beta-type acr-3-like [Symsagittifera roscoffensis]|uniref:acetylcholine receptor subunit beta-type acr-3-like n=1 Tax=Symsagittifera roscoffensis TaxID=84072 RepID=UPI00307B9E40